jgi:hypothetical protein
MPNDRLGRLESSRGHQYVTGRVTAPVSRAHEAHSEETTRKARAFPLRLEETWNHVAGWGKQHPTTLLGFAMLGLGISLGLAIGRWSRR